MDWPWTQVRGEKVSCWNEDGRFSEPCPGTFAGARDNGLERSSVSENTQEFW